MTETHIETPTLLQRAPPPSFEAVYAILTLELPAPTRRAIMTVCATICGTTIAGIRSPRGSAADIRARMIYYYAASALTHHSLPKIGIECGLKHHTSVLHGIRRVAANPAAFEPHLSLVMTRLNGPIGPGGMPRPRHGLGSQAS